jgi:hypothetical protein
MKITRIYDDNGQSRFTDIDLLPSLAVNAGFCPFRNASWISTRHHDGSW